MKSLFLACLLMVTSMYTLAQVAEGNKFVNGTVNLALLGGNNNLVVLAPSLDTLLMIKQPLVDHWG